MNRKQRAFAPLTDAEIDQIAGWLRLDTYHRVRDRIAKPRPEGFGLQLKSTRPLETLWQKKNTVDRINAKLATGEKLTLAELDAINSGEKADLPEKIHNAILEATYELVTDDENTPTQLLALQRLADFPARAEIRANRDQRHAEAHSWRAESHSWKCESHAMKREMHQCRLDTAAHRKHIAEERLALAKQALALRERIASSPNRNLNPNPNLFPPPQKNSKFVPWTAEDILHNQPKVEEAIRNDPLLSQIGLPPEDDPGPLPCSSRREEALTESLGTLPETSSETLSNSSNPSAKSAKSAVEPLPPPSLEDRVNTYTLARHREANIGKNADIVGRWASYTFTSNMQRCPCGELIPCPDHGDFPNWFFQVFPDHPDYIRLHELKKLPYTSPYELLRRQEAESTPCRSRREEALTECHESSPQPSSQSLSSTSAHQNVELNSFEMQP